MKKILNTLLPLLLAVFTLTGCGFDENPLQERLDSIKERIAALQGRIDQANSQVEALGLLTSGNVVTSVDKNSDGSYVLTYLDEKGEEKTALIASGDNKINIPVLGVRKDESGLYWWTVTTDGKTEDLVIDGKSVPAAGKAPVISVDAQGYWTADGERILDGAGNPIEAADGSSSIFKSVGTDADGNLALTLGNGSTVTVPVQNSLNLTLSSAIQLTIANLGQTLKIGYDVTGTKAADAIVAIAEARGVNASLDKTAKEVSVTFGSDFTSGHLIMMATDLDKATVLRPVFFDKAKETKITISTAEELIAFAERVNAQDGSENMDVYLEKDIDLSSVSSWTPIGNGTFSGTAVSGAAFKGKFYGQNHTVSGLKLVLGSGAVKGAVAGLFGVLQGATVKDLNIGEGSSLTSSSALLACGGAVAGVVVNSTVDHCSSSASFNISGGADNVSQRFGGVAGSVYSEGEVVSQVVNCSNFGAFKSVNTTNTKNGGTAFSIGGVVGYAESASSALRALVDGCDNYGKMDVQASRNAGVVATLNKNATVQNSKNFADITNTDVKASNTRVAGIVSALNIQTSALNCVNKGTISFAVAGNTTKGYAAGIVGQTNDNSCVVDGCENYGAVLSDIFNATEATKRFISIIVGNTNNKACAVTNNKVGGKVGPYSDASKVVTITADNFSEWVYYTPKTAPAVATGNVYAGEILTKGIASAQDFIDFAAAVNAGESTEKWQDEAGGVNLLNDIDMSSVKDWTPIGNATFTNASNVLTVKGPMFTGKFNGQGYKIRNFKMHSTVSAAGGTFGLFGVIGPGAVVENFIFESSCSLLVEAPGKNTSHGVIAGLLYDGTVRDVHSYAPMTFRSKTGANNAAQFMALIGYIFTENSDVIVDSVDNFGEIIAENLDGNSTGGATTFHIAGIAGFGTSTVATEHFVTISDCSNEGNMTSATCRTSGICAAANRRTKLVNCINRGNQLNSCPGPDKGRIGNIACNVANASSLTGCINYGDIISTTSARTAGIANLPNNCVISGCANYGNVQTDNQYRGLFWAYNNAAASWSDCIAGGTVGTYGDGKSVPDSYTDEAKMNYLGKQPSTPVTKLNNITYLIGVKEPEKPAESNAKLKILFIGNSFTKDAVEHLPGLLAAAGIKDIKLYHMYYGGRRVCDYNDGYNTSVDYHCYRCENGAASWTDVTGHSLHEIVSSDKWDIVTIQEHTGRAVAWDWTASQKAAFQGLVDKVKADCPDKTPDFYFIMSQAYHDMNKIATADRGQKNFTTTEEMYEVIVSMTKKLMADIPFKDVIATGTCLQNLRTSALNNEMCLTRDGYHMDYGISRYAAACMMFEKLISPSFDNVKLDNNGYRYSNSSTVSGSYSTPVTDANAPVALQAARYALQTPYSVTSMK